MPWGTKNMPPKKNLSRGSLSNWCHVDTDADADADDDADADADISKTICRPPPYGGVDINSRPILSYTCASLYFGILHENALKRLWDNLIKTITGNNFCKKL